MQIAFIVLLFQHGYHEHTLLLLLLLFYFTEKSKRRVSFFPYSLRVMERDKYQNCPDWLNESESYCLLYEAEGTSAR